jgi:TATA-box binding protein (TBP) (component of TFIID and TFIIIB)
MKLNFEIKEGDGNVIKDSQYKRMMSELKKIAKKGSELESEVLEKLKEREQAAAAEKTKKRNNPSSTESAPFLIQTKGARSEQKKRTQSAAEDGDDELYEDDEDEDNEDEENDENKFESSFITEEDDDAEAESAAAADAPLDEKFYQEMDNVFKENAMPGIIPTLPVIFIQNMVVTAKTEQSINIKALLPQLFGFGVYQNTKRFVAMTQRTRDPRSSTLCFSKGKFVNTGSQSKNAALVSIQSMVDKIKYAKFKSGLDNIDMPYIDMEIKSCTVHNIVGSTTVPFEINLDAMSKYKFVTYFKTLFVGGIVSMYEISQQARDKKAKALVFETGHVVFTGPKTIEHITDLYVMLYPYLARSAKQTASSSTATGKPTKARARRIAADKRKASSFPRGSDSVIPIDATYLVDEFKAVNQNRETSEQMLKREQEEKIGTLAGLSVQTKNEIAMHSMKEFQKEQESQQQESRKSKKQRLIEATHGGAQQQKTTFMDKTTAKLLATNF